MARRLWLELRVGWGPTAWLVPLGLVVLTLMHTGFGGGPPLWRVNFIENCEAFVPVAMGLASAPILLVEAEEHTWELTGMLPVSAVAGLRLVAVVGGQWLLVLAWLAGLRLVWGPVPYWQGFLAAWGPGLFLGGLATLTASAAGRVSLGYLMALGLPVADLVLKLLGALAAAPLLQFVNVFAYRWPAAVPPWWAVKTAMAAAGLLLYALAIRGWRTHGTRFM
jgi:hypothetical protein